MLNIVHMIVVPYFMLTETRPTEGAIGGCVFPDSSTAHKAARITAAALGATSTVAFSLSLFFLRKELKQIPKFRGKLKGFLRQFATIVVICGIVRLFFNYFLLNILKDEKIEWQKEEGNNYWAVITLIYCLLTCNLPYLFLIKYFQLPGGTNPRLPVLSLIHI
eukprot:TRINITY_DN6361_c0_g1_i2.p2 TRINITY_DN6361_c0_g1~~TRINITY_DN6361_c0_g1_i2.p2  ORF type:complete len:163 (-),score=17.34 TRINITY_DN6361_c0_g1_i2:12-500(-)